MKNKHIKQAVYGVLGAAALLKIVQRLWPSPAAAVPRRKRNNAPIVFVHGLGGWGEGSKLDSVFPHWGLTAGNIKEYLEGQGYEAYAASVNPVSSTWDRACELYAHLTGTRTDYGEAHAKAHNHERFGPTYEKLGPDWPDQNIHLIGHSFGGATIRLLAKLCAEGSAEERAVTPADELSPLFGGTNLRIRRGPRDNSIGGKKLTTRASRHLWLISVATDLTSATNKQHITSGSIVTRSSKPFNSALT